MRRAWLACSLVLGCTAPPVSDRPHIFLISADTLRADHLSIHGYARLTSPNLDRFGRSAWNFTNAITVLPKTGPSFATLFSGLHPEEHRVNANRYQIPEDVPLLAEMLGDHGYRNAAFVSNPVLSPRKGFARGFDVYEQRRTVKHVARSFTKWASRTSWSRPTFVWIHMIDPHGPYEPPEEYAEIFHDDALARSNTRRLPLEYDPIPGFPTFYVLGAIPEHQRLGSEDRVAAYVSRYDAEIRYVDDTFGSLMAFLRERGLYDSSAIVFLSDHGEAFGERDYYFEHGWYADDAGLRIPLFVKTPRQTRERRVDHQVSTLDLLPTILAIAKAVPQVPPSGRNVLEGLAEERAVVVENCASYPRRYVGLRFDGWKYVRDVTGLGDLTKTVDGTSAEELYDLGKDPGEEANVINDHPEKVRQMRMQLTASLKRLRVYPERDEPPVAPADGLNLEQLRSLGYVE